MPSITKKLAVFGGSGMTGLVVVEEALSMGLSLRLLLRPTSEFPSELQSKVEIVRGDVTDPTAVNKAVSGCCGVVVVLGTRNNLEETSEMSTGVKNILAAMAENGTENISVCLSSFLLLPEERIPIVFHAINQEHKRMLALLERSNTNWVAVLPPHIADIPRTQFQVKEGELPGGRTVSKRDLAYFLIDALFKSAYYQKRMAISSEVA